MVPALADQVTAELKAPVPSTVDEQEDVAPAFTLLGEQATDTEVTAAGAVTLTIVQADLVESWVETALICTTEEADWIVAGAVKMPVGEMLPAFALQVTPELKAPVPSTVAEQADVAPTLTLIGEQVTDSEVIVSGAPIEMVVEPSTVGVWVEVAVMVAVPEAGALTGAV